MSPGTIEAEAVIRSPHTGPADGPSGVYKATLPNGKEIYAFVPAKLQSGALAAIPADTRVIVRLTTFDFSSGMVLRLA